MTAHQRKPYAGTEKSLVIGIDIGTTFSAVSYALLEPGKVFRINPVTRFPGQTREKGYSKVPSIVCYDKDGHVIGVGPETDPEVNPILSEVDDIRRAEWFKLRLRPPHLAADKRSQLDKIWSLPEAAEDKDVKDLKHEPLEKIPRPVTDDFKTVVQIFADFLKYLFKSAEEYIEETERNINPTFTWSSIEKNIHFVLTHPNGWEGKQQSQMRDAAVAAGIVDRSTAANRIMFLTEGEAGLHFCLDKIPNLHQIEGGGGVLVVDCGGGTIDLSAYSQTKNGSYNEIVSPDCLLQGSIFVTSRARDYFKETFKGSQFGSDVGIEAMSRAFDKPEGAKCMFRNPTTPYFVKFGGLRDNDRKYGIANGKFKVEGAQMAKLFEPAVQDIIDGIENQCKNAKDGVSIKFVLLIGGFARSDYLYTKLSDRFKSSGSGIVVLRPDTDHLSKAVADGAVSYYVDRYVSARIAKYYYGIKASLQFDPADPEHARRKSTKCRGPDGKDYIPGYFSTILEKGTTVMEEKRFSEAYKCDLTPKQFSQWSMVSAHIIYYRGQATSPPQWLDLEPDSFHDACTIQADTTNVKRDLSVKNNGIQDFYQFDCEVVMLFGLTELKAYMAWKENGEEKRSDASIVYCD